MNVEVSRLKFHETNAYEEAYQKYLSSIPLYEMAEDELQPFVASCFAEEEGGEGIKATRVHELYDEWVEQIGGTNLGVRKLGMGLKTLLDSKRKSDGIYYMNVREII